MRKSTYDSRFGIPGSYDPMSVSAGSDFLAREFSMEIVHQIFVSVFEGLHNISVRYPPPAHVNVKLVTILVNRAFSEFQRRISEIST